MRSRRIGQDGEIPARDVETDAGERDFVGVGDHATDWLGVAFVTIGAQDGSFGAGRDASIEPLALVFKALSYFIALCAGVLILYVVAATIQSRRLSPRTVTFT